MKDFVLLLSDYYLESGKQLPPQILAVLGKPLGSLNEQETQIYNRYIGPYQDRIRRALMDIYKRSGATHKEWSASLSPYYRPIIEELAAQVLGLEGHSNLPGAVEVRVPYREEKSLGRRMLERLPRPSLSITWAVVTAVVLAAISLSVWWLVAATAPSRLLGQARDELGGGEYAMAIRHCDELEERYPGKEQAREAEMVEAEAALYYAAELCERGRYEEAIDHYDIAGGKQRFADQADLGRAGAYVAWARALKDEGDLEGSYDCCEEALYHAPGGYDTVPVMDLRAEVLYAWGEELCAEGNYAAISSDGRYVAFQSGADDLVSGDDNGCSDVFRKDLSTGDIVRCSTDSSGGESNGYSSRPSISSDGGYIAFHSYSSNLVADDVNEKTDIFRKDLSSGEIVLCSRDDSGGQGASSSYNAALSSDGRYVAFHSDYPFVPVVQYAHGASEVYLKDLVSGGILCCSASFSGACGNRYDDNSSITNNGEYVAFESSSYNLVPDDNNGDDDVFRKKPLEEPPSITSIDPPIGVAGTVITLRGRDFGSVQGDSSVFFGDSCGQEAVEAKEYIIWSDTTIKVRVPFSPCGDIYVWVTRGIGISNGMEYILLDPWFEVSPDRGPVGCEVTLTGDGFGYGGDGYYVSFGDVEVSEYSKWSDREIICKVPAGVHGRVDLTITTPFCTSDIEEFKVQARIDHMDPEMGCIGTEVVIRGSEFGHIQGDSYIRFEPVKEGFPGETVFDVTSWTDTAIELLVPRELMGEMEVYVYVDGVCSYNAGYLLVLQYAVGFAEGYTGNGFQEYLCIGNPNDYKARVEIIYLFPDGTYWDQDLDVPAASRTTVNVNEEIGPGWEVSAMVFSDLEVVVERAMYFNYKGKWRGGHDVVGTPYISPYWFFAEGYTGPGFEEWICVLNPNLDPANLTFHFLTQEEGEVIRTESVAGLSRGSFNVNELLGANYQCSLVLESDQLVLAERPMYFDYTGFGNHHWQGGHCVMGEILPYTEYYFAEGTTRGGFDEWITLVNPLSEAVTVNATYQLGSGQGDPVRKNYVLPPESRYTVYVPDEVGAEKDVSLKLASSDYFLAERPMYFRFQGYGVDARGGHCVLGAASLAEEWVFAEGYTGGGFQEWLCLQNPGDEESVVEVWYLVEDGSKQAMTYKVPARSRKTLRINEEIGDGKNVSCHVKVVSGPPIMAERPMYFNYFAGEGGHDVSGYSPIGLLTSSSSAYGSAGLGEVGLLRDAWAEIRASASRRTP
ncbi:MAG: IPT/TIG domain-containing protein [Actinomycetota bacterium]|nr:IPT/TIG domain-containing protein [Actinomycetota bacterium]